MVIAVRYIVRYATVRVVPHSVVVGQQRCLTVKLRHTKKGIGIGVLPVGHHNLNSDDLGITGESGSYLSNGCIWYTTFGGRGYFTYGGKVHAAPVGLDSGDEVSAAVDRRTNSGNGSKGVVRFLRNGKALDTEPLCPLGLPWRPSFW